MINKKESILKKYEEKIKKIKEISLNKNKKLLIQEIREISDKGVWILVFRDNLSEEYLEVGKCKKMKKELLEDLEIIEKEGCICNGCSKEDYIARKTKNFRIKKCKMCDEPKKEIIRKKYAKKNPRRVDKYRDILDKYERENLSFEIYEIEDESILKTIESEIAKELEVKYWYS